MARIGPDVSAFFKLQIVLFLFLTEDSEEEVRLERRYGISCQKMGREPHCISSKCLVM